MANSLKDMLASVDWRKMLSSQDTKNALIGSALGGLMLGGAGLMSDRDPEESRLAPVGDALMGALLGGVAGYGIPKGLAMFRDAGSLAPDNDRLRHNYALAGGLGAAAGAGTAGVGLYKTLRDRASAMKDDAAAKRQGWYNAARDKYNEAVRSGSTPEITRAYKNIMRMYDVSPEGTAAANKVLDGVRRARWKAFGTPDGELLKNHLKELVGARKKAVRGYASLGELVRAVGNYGNKLERPSTLDGLLHPRKWFSNWASAGHYHTGRLAKVGPYLSSATRMGMRAGKYGLAGAGAALLLHKLLGPSAQPNFKD